MKIAIASPRIGLVDRGGEIQLCALASRLAARGHAVTVYAGAPIAIGNAKVVPLSPGLPTAREFRGKLRLDQWWFALAAYGRMALDPPDVVVPVIPPAHEFLARRLRQFHGTAILSIGLGGPEDDGARVASRPDWFIVSSPSAKATLMSSGVRTEVVPPGVDLEQYCPSADLAEIDLPRPIFGAVGALIPCKRLELAIAALATMKQGSLLVIGSGPERQRLEAAARPQAIRVRFIDHVSPSEMPRYYRAMDALCFPAAPVETFGMVLIEAMACGTTVVANDDEVRRWIVGGGGELCDVTRPEIFAAALERAASRKYPTRREAARFSWESAADRVSALVGEKSC